MSNEHKNSNADPESDNVIARPGKVVPTQNRWKSVNINIFVYMVIGLLLFLGTCGVAQSMGWWSTSGKVKVTGENVTVTGANPAEIRGFMTIREVIVGYNVTWEEFREQFNLPPETSLDSPLNTLEKLSPDFSVTNVRNWLTQRSLK